MPDDSRLPESVEKALLALVDYTDLAYDPGVAPLRAAIVAALQAERQRIPGECPYCGDPTFHGHTPSAARQADGD